MLFSPALSRRTFLERSTLLAAGTLFTGCVASRASTAPAERLLYVGSYGPTEHDNLWLYRLNLETGELIRVAGFRGGPKPSYLTFDYTQRFLYAVNASLEYQGRSTGSIRAFAIDQQSGALTLLNEQSSEGAGPCYISLSTFGHGVLVANYFGGSVAALPIQSDGSLCPARSLHQRQGSGPHKNQDKAHPHCVLPDMCGRYNLAVDLGTDQVPSYPLKHIELPLQLDPKVAFRG